MENDQENPSDMNASQSTAAGQHAPPPPTCRCGYTRDHFWVSPKAQYSNWGFIMGLFMGVSAGDPKSIKFVCRQCDQVIEESFDPHIIKQYNQS